MSALLEKMIDNQENNEIELCILWVLDDAENWSEDCAPYEHARRAAAELEALTRRAEQAAARIEVMQKFSSYAYYDHKFDCNPKQTGVCTCGYWDARDAEVKTSIEYAALAAGKDAK